MGNAERMQEPAPLRVIKRYSNRKLYDTRASSYVTLLNISEMVRSGEHVQVIDNATKEDKTDVTLALIISEELKANPREVPVAVLKALVRRRGGRLMHQLKEGALGRLLALEEEDPEGEEAPSRGGTRLRPGEAEIDEESMDVGTEGREARGLRGTLEQLHQMLDERISAFLPHWAAFQELERRVAELTQRVEQLEGRLGSGPGQANAGGKGGPAGPGGGAGIGG